jgi:hypothetical protein
MVIGKRLRQTTERTFFVEQIIHTKRKQQRDKQRNVNVARSHPCHCEYQYIPTERVFQVGFHGFAEFNRNEFRRYVQRDDNQPSKHLALV